MTTQQEAHDEEIARSRFLVVCQVRALVAGGVGVTAAVAEVAARPQLDARGRLCEIAERSLWRWYSAWTTKGAAGLEVAARSRAQVSVLPAALIELIREHKRLDEEIAIPEILRLAAAKAIIEKSTDVDRTTVWRFCRREGLPTGRRQPSKRSMQRPWRYPNRMLCVLADGKHFRAGSGRAKRVTIIFLDNATRFILAAVVGTGESSALVLRGLRKVIERWGLMEILYVDLGPGFKAKDLARVCRGVIGQSKATLSIALILGTKSYPEGRAAIERFNRTIDEQLLCAWPGNPTIEPDFATLERRIEHWATEIYNHSPHEGLRGIDGLRSPAEVFHGDERALVYPVSIAALDEAFVTSFTRKVSLHNCISHGSKLFEMPLGHRGKSTEVYRHMIDGRLFVLHKGRRVPLNEVDLEKNAHSKRAASITSDQPKKPRTTAADVAFERDNPPLTDPDGNYRGDEE